VEIRWRKEKGVLAVLQTTPNRLSAYMPSNSFQLSPTRTALNIETLVKLTTPYVSFDHRNLKLTAEGEIISSRLDVKFEC
jgi:hypothetical protein